MGCGGRGSVRREKVFAGRPSRERARRARRTALKRTAKPCGPDTRGWCQAVGGDIDPTGSISHQAGSDGGKTNSSPGRARHKPSTHCAGNAGVLRLYLYARVRTSSCTLHTRPRVQQAPGIPCSLCLEGKGSCKPRAQRAARRRDHVSSASSVIASAAKQSMALQKRKNGLLRCARNDVDKPQDAGYSACAANSSAQRAKPAWCGAADQQQLRLDPLRLRSSERTSRARICSAAIAIRDTAPWRASRQFRSAR
jgi:hypothetical protein